jgi:hypothetical protein
MRAEVGMGTVDERPAVRAAAPAQEEGAREVEMHLLARPRRLDWERLIEDGTVPALVLGAERRLRR